MRKYITLFLACILALIVAVIATGCVDTLADALTGDNGPPGRVDTLVVVQPPDTIYCHWKHGHRECWR